MLKLFQPIGTVSTNFNLAQGSFVGASPSALALLFLGTLSVDAGVEWESGTFLNTEIGFGAESNQLTGPTGTFLMGSWVSQIYDFGFPSAITFFDLVGTSQGTLVSSVRAYSRKSNNLVDIQTQAWKPVGTGITSGIVLQGTYQVQDESRRYSQFMFTLDDVSGHDSYIDEMKLNFGYDIEADTNSKVKRINPISVNAEVLFNRFEINDISIVVDNTKGWWNYDGRLENTIGTTFFAIRRGTTTGTIGTYQLNVINNTPINTLFGEVAWLDSLAEMHAFTPLLIRMGPFPANAGVGTIMAGGGIGTKTFIGFESNLDFYGTHPEAGTTCLMIGGTSMDGTRFKECGVELSNFLTIQTDTVTGTAIFCSLWYKGLVAPKLWLTSSQGIFGTVFGTFVGTATAGGTQWQQLSFFGTVKGTTSLKFCITSNEEFSGFGTLMWIEKAQLNIGTINQSTQWTSSAIGAGSSEYILVFGGDNNHIKRTNHCINNTEYLDLISGVHIKTGTMGTRNKANVNLGIFFAHRYNYDSQPPTGTQIILFNEKSQIWEGWKYGYTGGTSWGTEEYLPAFFGRIDGFSFDEKNQVTITMRNKSKLLSLNSSEKCGTYAGTATGTWWQGKKVDFLIEQLLLIGANWGTNLTLAKESYHIGTVGTEVIGTADFGATIVSEAISELSQLIEFAPFVDGAGKFWCMQKNDINAGTVTIEENNIKRMNLNFGEDSGYSPIINRMVYGLDTQSGTTEVLDGTSIAKYGTHTERFTNKWAIDLSNQARLNLMNKYITDYANPKRIAEMTIKYNPKIQINDRIQFQYIPFGVYQTTSWKVLGLTQNIDPFFTSLTLREI